MNPPATRNLEDLRRLLSRLDGRGYPAYKELAGTYDCGHFLLQVDHVQGDPFAAPSRLRLVMEPRAMNLPQWAISTPRRRVATADWLLRRFHDAIGAVVGSDRRGSGKSGMIAVDRPGQEILPRTACVVGPDRVEVRFAAGLPAAGRRILGRQALEMLCHDVPRLVERALRLAASDLVPLQAHVAVVEDQAALREALAERGLVAFVGDGAVLPRASGVSDRPLRGPQVVAFEAPASLAVELDTPHRGRVRGLGIPQGVTLIVGGGYHGKSTLLRALARGVYDHIPGDGRELVVTDPTAVKIRAEDGRRVEQVDISAFIRNLPFGADTTRFCSDEASGSTSQAANIIEALELGSRLLLIDEDTSATNFMIRDRRMQALVSKDREPITPFIDRVRALYRDRGVSSIIVVGGAGDYLDVADTVIRMDAYRAQDATEEAREVASRFPTGRLQEDPGPFPTVPERVPLPASLDPRRGGKLKVRAYGVDEIAFGTEEIDLHAVEQVVDPSQTRAIGAMIRYMTGRHLDGQRSLREALELLYSELADHGLDRLWSGRPPLDDLALPRPLEVGAAINRLRSLRVKVRAPEAAGRP